MAKKAALKEFADSLRARGGLEYQTAKYPVHAGREDYEWRDYVRGKDLAKLLRAKQELLDEHTKPVGPGRSQDDQVSDLVVRLLQAKLLAPADRKFKKPKPGKKKVVKWPRTLDHAEPEWSEELFYVFTYDKPTSWLFYVGAAMVVLGVLGATLFPLAPYRVKIVVLYSLSTLLSAMVGTMLLRYVVWAAVWLVSGSHFWLLPNLMSETLPLGELFRPALDFSPRDPSDRLSSLPARGAVGAVLGAACWALLVMGPDASAVKDGVRGAQDSVLKYFDMVDAMKAGITNGTAGPAPPGKNGSSTSTAGPAAAADRAAADGTAAAGDADSSSGGGGEQAQAREAGNSGSSSSSAGGEGQEEEWADAREEPADDDA